MGFLRSKIIHKFKYQFFCTGTNISIVYHLRGKIFFFFFVWMSKILKFKESKQEVDISFILGSFFYGQFFFFLGNGPLLYRSLERKMFRCVPLYTQHNNLIWASWVLKM